MNLANAAFDGATTVMSLAAERPVTRSGYLPKTDNRVVSSGWPARAAVKF